MNSKQKAMMNEAMWCINNAEQLNDKLKAEFPEYPLCEYKVYDRNLAMRVMFNNVKTGEATGNCLMETTKYFLEKFNPFCENTMNQNSHLCKAYMYGGMNGTEIIFHCFIVVVSEGKKYYITHSNGVHKVVPFTTMMKDIINLELANFGMKKKAIKVRWMKFAIDEYGNIQSSVPNRIKKKRVSVRNRLANKIRAREQRQLPIQ